MGLRGDRRIPRGPQYGQSMRKSPEQVPADDLSQKSSAQRHQGRGAPGVAKFFLLFGALIGFFVGGAYGTLTFWFADRTGDPGSIIDVRLLSRVLGLLAAVLGAVVGFLSGLGGWGSLKLFRADAGGPKSYLSVVVGAASVTLLCRWLVLRNVEPISFSISSGASFVAVASAASLGAARLYLHSLRRSVG